MERKTFWPSLHWPVTIFVSFVHLMAVVALYYMTAVHFSGATLGLGIVWYVLCILAITAGYHRLYSHASYKARLALELFYAFFGAAGFQNTIKVWAGRIHPEHHRFSDTDRDPHNIRKGFWWAHVGWVLSKGSSEHLPEARALRGNKVVSLQHKPYIYLPLAVLFGFVLPAGIAWIWWGDALGAVLVAGFLRITVQYHATWSVNSIAHYFGDQVPGRKSLARNARWWGPPLTIPTLGELGCHGYHHSYPKDYRNGPKWYHLDVTKWFIWTCSKVGLAYDLVRTPPEKVEAALQRA